MFMLVLAIFIFGAASVCASDVNDTVIASEDDSSVELSQADTEEMISSEEDELIGQTELIIEGNSGTFAELQANITQATEGSTLTLYKNYECEDDFSTAGIIINKSITIDGQGNKINAQGKSRIFNISADNVIIKNITFTNGNANGDNFKDWRGGAIHWIGSNAEVLDCTFTHNNGANGEGGAIFCDGGRINFFNCTFTDNSALQGGAIKIYRGDDYHITNCIFTNNNAGSGGAIYQNHDNATISNSIFADNSASTYGGAIIWVYGYYGAVLNCIFTNNSSPRGCAIHLSQTRQNEFNVSKCSFVRNTGNYTIRLMSYSSFIYSKINNNIFLDNIVDSNILYEDQSSDYTNVEINADNNWFGSTASNYAQRPIDNDNIICDSWLFLNGTANPDNISVFDSSSIAFKLFKYNSSSEDITEYDNTLLPAVNLTLSSQKGNTDKGNAGLNEAIEYTATAAGTGSITATIGNVTCTKTLTVTDGTTFWDLNKTINGNTNDTITLDKDYAYNQTTDSAFTKAIAITRQVTINGNGHTIDAKGQARIFYVGGDNVTINNVTFVNGKTDNVGGAILWVGDNGAVSGCSFIGNTAVLGGGAISSNGGEVTISGSSFINNTAESGGAIYWNFGNGNISNSIFINNHAAYSVSDAIEGKYYLTVDYCWFGGNATNYLDLSIVHGAVCHYILFLNATANPNEVPAFSTSEIVFKLYLYNRTSGNISEYDNTLLLPVNLTVTSTNGDVDIHTVNLGDSIRYTATSRGTGSITASIENVKYTIETTNLGLNPDLSVDSQEADYSNRTIIAINYNSSATGTVNITLKGKNGNNYTFTNFALNATILLSEAINADEYDVNVTYSGDNVFLNATATGKLTINKANSTLTINDNVTFDYNTNGSTTVSYTHATGVNASVVGQPNAIVVVNDTTITVSGLNAGNYTLTVTTITDANHNNITKNATITVNKLQTELSGNAITATYNVNSDLVVTLKDSNGNPVSGAKLIVDLNGAKTYTTDSNGQVKVSTKGLAPKAYTAKITFNGNTNYAKSTKDVKVTVKKATAKLTAKKKTFKTSVKTKKYTIVLKDNTGKAIKKAKVTLKVKGKTYKATTNSKGKAVFKIKNLKKKGTFKATITYKGNKYYNKVSKKANIKVIVTFKTVSKGSKDKSTVKEIQQALKDHGYYLSYKGHYLKIDGKFKGCTERSVKEFQKDKGLKATGKVDEKTAKKLGII